MTKSKQWKEKDIKEKALIKEGTAKWSQLKGL